MRTTALQLKQLALKPQDVLTTIRIAIAEPSELLTFASMSDSLGISVSEAHASVQRATVSGLITREFDELRANRTALLEFIAHGLRYAFPPIFGPVARGIATSVFAEPLSPHFSHGDSQALVWPHPEGTVRGPSLCPLYPSIPSAALRQQKLHEVLALIDAVRAGAARERELAINFLPEYFHES